MTTDTPNSTLMRTALYQAHLDLGARMVPFAGYEMPVQYSGVLNEVKQTRSNIGIFDVSHMAQFEIEGRDAIRAVDALVTGDVSSLAVGQAQYAMLCQPDGGVIDDLVVYRRGESTIFICANASNRFADRDWILSRLNGDLRFQDLSDSLSLIAVQGPGSEALISSLVSDPTVVSGLRFYTATNTTLLREPVFLSRTGYTGEDGFELYVSNESARKVWDALLKPGTGAVPVGLGARDTLRLEMGYPLHGHELSQEISPLEAGLGWTVRFAKKSPFIGQERLEQQKAEGVTRQLVAFTLRDRRIARTGYPVVKASGPDVGKPIGVITSGTQSPTLNCPIGLALIQKSRHALETAPCAVEIRGDRIEMQMVKLPFVPSHTKKAPRPKSS